MEIKRILNSSPAFIIPALISLASLCIMPRFLSLTDFGRLSISLISIEFFQGLIYQWIKLGTVRFYKVDFPTRSIKVGMQYNILLTTVLVLIFAYIYINAHESKTELAIISCIIGRGYTYYILDCIKMQNENFAKYTIWSLIFNICYYLPSIIVVLVFNKVDLWTILYTQSVSVTIPILTYISLNYKTYLNLKTLYSKNIYGEFVSYAAPLIVVYFFSNMFVRIDRYIIEHNVGLKEVGIYSAAYSLSNLSISSFFSVLTLPTYPEIIRKLNNGEYDLAKKIYDQNGKIILLFGVPSICLAILIDSFMCEVMFGYEKGKVIEKVFPMILISVFFYNYKVHYFDQVFQFIKKTKHYMILGAISGTTHLIISYLITPKLGIEGIAISSIAINISLILYIYNFSKKSFPVTINRYVWLYVVIIVFVSSIGCLFL